MAYREMTRLGACLADRMRQGEGVAIDGTYLRQSYDTSHGTPAIQVVDAWATQHLMLPQVVVEPTTHESSTVPQVLEQLASNGCRVILDALNTQTATAQQIVE
jgi:EAL domain-containing protein (putative c-di-GMP-specific phosphodiesterase class I)